MKTTFAISLLLGSVSAFSGSLAQGSLGSKNALIAQLCPCNGSRSQQWGVAAVDAPSYIKTVANATKCLTIEPGPPTWGPEGSGAVIAPVGSIPQGFQQWTIDSKAKQILWPHNSSMCLTVLPPKPAPNALVGLWFCGKQGFEASQSFKAVVDGAAPDYKLQLTTTDNQFLCVSEPGSC